MEFLLLFRQDPIYLFLEMAPYSPHTHYAVKDGLELQVLRVQACAIMPGFCQYFK